MFTENDWVDERNAQIIKDKNREKKKTLRPFLADLWHERHGLVVVNGTKSFGVYKMHGPDSIYKE